MSLFDLKRGESAKISAIKVVGSARTRLTALGITVGETVEVLSFSLFKSSVLISCNAVRVALRKPIAKQIEVKS